MPRPHRTPDSVISACLRRLSVDNIWDYVCPDPNTGCWLWCGQWNEGNYGRFAVKVRGRWHRVAAHRVVWTLFRGRFKRTHVLDHVVCQTHQCVNPWHTEPVTERTNIHRGRSPSAKHVGKTHCVNGHRFTKENTYKRRSGGRDCRQCKRNRSNENLRSVVVAERAAAISCGAAAS